MVDDMDTVDELSTYYADLLQGSYDCIDRIVLNAYYTLCYSAGGFRTWWRQLMNGQEETLDTAHLMRLAGRFSRRVRAYAEAHAIPVVDCTRGDRKHEIAAAYLAAHPQVQGLFLILVSRAVAPVWEVQRAAHGVSRHLVAKKPYVKHYSGSAPFSVMTVCVSHRADTGRTRTTRGIDRSTRSPSSPRLVRAGQNPVSPGDSTA